MHCLACLFPWVSHMFLQTLAQPSPVTGADATTFQPTTAAPAFTAVNPPSCAQEWADTLNFLTKFSVDVTYASSQCAYNMGWYGETPYGNKQVYYSHNGRGCAGLIIDAFAQLFAAVSALEGAAFDCFNNNQACGQAIASAGRRILEGSKSLVSAADDCSPPGGHPPYFDSGYDIPVKGFSCWADIWHFGQRILKTSKYIDVALGTCETAPPTPTGGAATPAPTDGAGTPPTPTGDGDNSSAPTGPAPTAESSTDTNTSLGASWSSLQQPQPFEDISADDAGAAERRLSAFDTFDTTLSDEGYEQLKQARESLVGFLKAYGAVSTKEAQIMMEWTSERFASMLPMIDAFLEGVEDAQAADDNTSMVV